MSKQLHKKDGVEILCIGTELLLGDILNSNARWIAKQLALLGLPHYLQTVVGDNADRLKEVVIQTATRSRILITTGGLGPTPDDLTTETIANAFKTPLKENLEAWLDIQEKTSKRGYLRGFFRMEMQAYSNSSDRGRNTVISYSIFMRNAVGSYHRHSLLSDSEYSP